mmetsp:Transcript_26072/g.37066  ORF Transcript_26072/g.37066 Transcript_26072/m.37066 type:complete len:264 (-) Transcript_26072:218-1009(-)|eukprot:CAMPEP_0202469374 /NCGR_PEP_ID=MMETSP1360-20130828/78332_1 /ASSEMBLY_ACC=CAM_ASM_000848 /TAXON_ID=515479 /ORGANISM="Licmophora paradoxa, Strain CCMP2313" /LENGTH=263 /DNA_ID=CAMNT_0049094707 /DNA_START=65 /DNA_END=856 /DNA_ORIENTATION=+
MSSSTDEKEEKHLHAALQYAIGRMCASEDTTTSDTHLTQGAIQTLTSLTYLYATTALANDLVHFSRHAKRLTISPDDVLLIARKDPGTLQERLREFARLQQVGLKTGATPIRTKNTPLPRETPEERHQRTKALFLDCVESSDEGGEEGSVKEMEFQIENTKTSPKEQGSSSPHQLQKPSADLVDSDSVKSSASECGLQDSSSDEEEGAPKRRRLAKLTNKTEKDNQQSAKIARNKAPSPSVMIDDSSSSDESLDMMMLSDRKS